MQHGEYSAGRHLERPQAKPDQQDRSRETSGYCRKVKELAETCQGSMKLGFLSSRAAVDAEIRDPHLRKKYETQLGKIRDLPTTQTKTFTLLTFFSG